jgi:lipoprotein signal peptidase
MGPTRRDRIVERLALTVLPAALLAAVDLSVKASVAAPSWSYHARSDAWFALSAALLVGALALALVPSRWVAVAAGVMSGGVVGNLVSARLDGNRVPNPILLGSRFDGIAFNAADVFILAGIVLLTAALIAVTIGNRDRLIPPRSWERELRRRLLR